MHVYTLTTRTPPPKDHHYAMEFWKTRDAFQMDQFLQGLLQNYTADWCFIEYALEWNRPPRSRFREIFWARAGATWLRGNPYTMPRAALVVRGVPILHRLIREYSRYTLARPSSPYHWRLF